MLNDDNTKSSEVNKKETLKDLKEENNISEEKLKRAILSNNINEEKNKDKRSKENENLKTIIVIIATFVFLTISFGGFYLLQKIEIDHVVASVVSLVSGGFVVYIILLTKGIIKEFTIKGGTFELSSKINDKFSQVENKIDDSNKDLSRRIDSVVQSIQTINATMSTTSKNTNANNQTSNTSIIIDLQKEERRTINHYLDTPFELNTIESLPYKFQQELTKLRQRKKQIDELHFMENQPKITGPKDLRYQVAAEYYVGRYNKALEILDKMINEDDSDVIALSNKAVALRQLGKLDLALEFHNKALIKNIERNERSRESRNYNDIGIVYRHMGNLTESLKQHKKALEINDKLPKDQRVARYYNDAGITCRQMGLMRDALNYHQKALSIDRITNNTVRLAMDYNAIGIVFREIGNPGTAITYHKLALAINEREDIKIGIARNYNNVGLAYMDLKETKHALHNLFVAYEIYKNIFQENQALEIKVGMAKNYNAIGLVYRSRNEPIKSIKYHMKSLEINQKSQINIGIARNYNNIGLAIDKLIELKKKTKDGSDKKTTDLWNFISDDTFDKENIEDSIINLEKETKDLDQYVKSYDTETIKTKLEEYDVRYLATFKKLCYLKALKINEEINNQLGFARVYTAFGDVMINENNPQAAITWYKKSLSIHDEKLKIKFEKIRDLTRIAHAYQIDNKLDEYDQEMKKSMEEYGFMVEEMKNNALCHGIDEFHTELESIKNEYMKIQNHT